jgi:hypothetical protein
MNAPHRAWHRVRRICRQCRAAAPLLIAVLANPAGADGAVAGSATAGGGGDAPLPVLVESAMVQAQQLTGQPWQRLRLLDATAVHWPDGAGGCPEPGRMYTQGTGARVSHPYPGARTGAELPRHAWQHTTRAVPGGQTVSRSLPRTIASAGPARDIPLPPTAPPPAPGNAAHHAASARRSAS